VPDTFAFHSDFWQEFKAGLPGGNGRKPSAFSWRWLWTAQTRHWRLTAWIVGSLMLICLLYCRLMPGQYEATAQIALRTSSASPLNLETIVSSATAPGISAEVQQETLASVLRSHQLAWKVITDLKLYQEPGFIAHTPEFLGGFTGRFPGFRPQAPSAGAQTYLLERFMKGLRITPLRRSLLVQIRFRSRDADLSAAVVNDLIRLYDLQESKSRQQETVQASQWLESQLRVLKKRMEGDQRRLTAFQAKHGLLDGTMPSEDAPQGKIRQEAATEVEELERQLASATADRIQQEAEYRAASQGDPEAVLASQRGRQNAASSVLAQDEQIRTRRSALEQEQARLGLEHGPNYPRLMEIRTQLQDLDRQKKAEDTRILKELRSSWQTCIAREHAARQSLRNHTAETLRQSQAVALYETMRQEASVSHDLYLQVERKVQEAGMTAGIQTSKIALVDRALPPAKPVTPNLPLDLAITFFASLGLAAGSAIFAEAHRSFDAELFDSQKYERTL
jgi:uncharacterized protein involved in exopolysaccharide biosynthesis